VFNGPETVTNPRPRKLVSRQRLRLVVGKCPVRISAEAQTIPAEVVSEVS
jgi:hypothetical protein